MATLSPRRVLLIVAFGYLLASWAMNPVSSILPTITSDLQIDVTRAGWVMNAYFVLLVGGVLIAGRLGDAFGLGTLALFPVVMVLGAGLGVFTAAAFGYREGFSEAASAMALVAAVGVVVVLYPVLRERALLLPALGPRFRPTE